METIIKIFLTSILYVGCIIMMILCISDMLSTKKKKKKIRERFKSFRDRACKTRA